MVRGAPGVPAHVRLGGRRRVFARGERHGRLRGEAGLDSSLGAGAGRGLVPTERVGPPVASERGGEVPRALV